MTQPIPNGYRSITPSLTFKDSKKALDFYKKAFGAKTLDLFPNMDGKGIMHATMQIGDSIVMMGDEMSEKCASAEKMGGSPVSLFLYVPDVDMAFVQAVAAGAKVDMPVTDMFWGDRAGNLTDPFGYCWMLATHKEDLSKDQIRQKAEKFFAEWKSSH